jgi:hypothetical protein
MQREWLESNGNEILGRNNETKIVFFFNVIRYCIFYVLMFYMAHFHCMEPLCNLCSARECVCVCVCVFVTSITGRPAQYMRSPLWNDIFFFNSKAKSSLTNIFEGHRPNCWLFSGLFFRIWKTWVQQHHSWDYVSGVLARLTGLASRAAARLTRALDRPC